MLHDSRFRRDFPDATAMRVERFLGFPKSLIAIRQAVAVEIEAAASLTSSPEAQET